MLSSTCMFSGSELTINKDRGFWFKETKNKILSRDIQKIVLEGIAVNKGTYIEDKAGKLIFVRLDKNPSLLKKTNEKGKVMANLLIAKNPEAILQAISQAYINRPEGGNFASRKEKHTSDRVGIDKYCAKDRCYTLEWELYKGAPGDPLFLLSKKHGKAEFLVGLNAAEALQADDWDEYVSFSKKYRVLDASTLSALQRVIKPLDPAAFQRIQSHIINELNF